MPTPLNSDPRDRTLCTLNPLNDPQWDADVSRLFGATIFHGSAWAGVLHNTYGFTPIYLSERDPARHHYVLPLMEANSWLTGRRGIALPFTDECAPLCQDAKAFDRLFQTLSAHGEQRKWKYWEMRGGRTFLPDVPASLSFWGHSLKLGGDRAALFSGLESSTRRAVRRAEQSGLRVGLATSLDSVRTFYHLIGLTRRRHGLPPQPFAFFENIHRQVLARNQGALVLAHFNNIPVAGAMFFHFGKTALYKFGASDESFQHLRANNLVMWHALESYIDTGFSAVDFGRTSVSNDGLRRFKLAWGATERQIEYFKYDRAGAQFVSSHDDSTGWYNRLFRLMPPALSRIVGAAAYKHMA